VKQHRRRREQSAEMRHVGVPLIGATIAAGGMVVIAALDHVGRFFGVYPLDDIWRRNYGPIAWSDVPLMAGLLFVVTFVVLAIKAFVWPSD
jgi:hypothetical protein